MLMRFLSAPQGLSPYYTQRCGASGRKYRPRCGEQFVWGPLGKSITHKTVREGYIAELIDNPDYSLVCGTAKYYEDDQLTEKISELSIRFTAVGIG